MLNILPRQDECTDILVQALSSSGDSSKIINWEWAALGCINPDTDTESIYILYLSKRNNDL
jgi:hypothetical protein